MRRAFLSERVRLGDLEREAERGDMDRRGERTFEGVRDWAGGGVTSRERDRPRDGERDDIGELKIQRMSLCIVN